MRDRKLGLHLTRAWPLTRSQAGVQKRFLPVNKSCLHFWGNIYCNAFAILLVVLTVAAAPFNQHANAASSAVSASTFETPVPTVVVSSSGSWLRQSIQISEPTAKTELFLRTEGIVTVYLNGQRLSRSVKCGDDVLTWDVGSLLRTGTNCVAVYLNGEDRQSTTLNVWLSGLQDNAWKSNPWKLTTNPPPIGWQQTDFNDRDWKAATVGSPLDVPSAIQGSVRQMAWAVESGSSRFKDGSFQFRNNDHVVLLGGTFVERAQSYGYLETALNSLAGDAEVTFRNLGWSADNVFAESRGIFDTPAKGYERMIEHVRAEEPTVIVLCYGQNEAMDFSADSAGLDKFTNQLKQLHKDLLPTGAEIIFVTPHPFAETSAPLPNAARWNSRLKVYADAVTSVGESLNVPVIDLYTGFLEYLQQSVAGSIKAPLRSSDVGVHPDLARARLQGLSENGMHWNSAGYCSLSPLLRDRISGREVSRPVVAVDLVEKLVSPTSGQVRNVVWSTTNSAEVKFEFRPDFLWAEPLVVALNDAKFQGPDSLRVTVAVADGGDAVPVKLTAAPSTDDETMRFSSGVNEQFEALRELTVRKNELYFHRWRPQNITYLFGFRKHEQGNNAVEIAQFDPLVDELEKQIHDLKQPQWQTITTSQSGNQ